MPSIASILATAQAALTDSSDSARLDSELLLCYALKKNRSYLYAHKDLLVEKELTLFNKLLSRRMEGEPIAYIVEQQEFWSLPFKVSSATLIPRPETELLVETALAVTEIFDKDTLNVIDLGTGSGCIAIALASERMQWDILAVDSSTAALDIARYNAKNLNVGNVCFQESDWFTAVQMQKFDLVIANPPYIDKADPHLQNGDVRFEPQSALVANNNGLAAYERIIQQVKDYLHDNSILLFEVGYQQSMEVMQLLKSAAYANIETKKDLAGHDRVVVARQ